MSYDISIKALIETEVYDNNYTYNVYPMFRKALGGDGINDLHGVKCRVAAEKLAAGINNMCSTPDEYKALNPSNKWGDYEGALKVLRDLMIACDEYPDGIVQIS